MKIAYRLLLPSLLLTTTVCSNVYADAPWSGDQLSQYLKNLGLYLGGYDITNAPNPTPATGLINASATALPEQNAINTMLGALTVNTSTPPIPGNFVSSDNPLAAIINKYTNTTFKSNPAYNVASSPSQNQQTGVPTVSALIDQQTYQQDPVSQAILNILTTPDYTYCTNNDNSAWVPNCPLLTQKDPLMPENLVIQNIIGDIPDPVTYYTNKYNSSFIGQLNTNTLLSPLLYSTTPTNQNSTSAGSSGTNTTSTANVGLTANSQAQEAANFIRYVSGAVTPLVLPKRSEYTALYTTAITTPKDGNPSVDQIRALSTLSNYLANVRVYAAQTSVGLSNLYYIFSKRLPQGSAGSDSNTKTSQALSEFKMATWRLNTSSDPSTSWLNQINQASPAAVEKEMVTLLAEINYQLYLNRQQEERILLTNSLLLLQNAHSSQPSASQLSPSNASAAAGS